MKQVIASLGTGRIEVVDVPRPRPGRGELVIANEYSVVSTGTERMLVEFGASSLVNKARSEPGRVGQVVDKALTDGIAPTVRAVQARLEEPIPLGYSSAGVVLEVGEGVEGFAVGDRVAANGAHAEIVAVRARLAARVPDGVSSRDAAFGTLASVAINALREADVDFGSTVAVIGLGLVGQLLVRIATNAGHRVVAFDPREDRVELAQAAGVEASTQIDRFCDKVRGESRGIGADGVIIAANVGDRAAGNDPIDLVGQVARRQATVVLVGNGDPTLDRRTWYEDELRFVVARAYGPGRDDQRWEAGTVDYPHQVRWTARRNLELALDLMARGDLTPSELVDTDWTLEQAPAVYEELSSRGALTALFRHENAADDDHVVHRPPLRTTRHAPGVAVIGAGNFAKQILIPALDSNDVNLQMIVSRSGLSSVVAGRQFGFQSSTTNLDRVLDSPLVDVVFVATRHDSHPEIAVRALEAGKHVWLEKPIAVDRDGLEQVADAWRATRERGTLLTVGFNRRFAPTVVRLREELADSGPLSLVYTVNAGPLPRDHWLRDRNVGGGRIVGEACHFVDLLRFLTGSPIVSSHALVRPNESATLTFQFAHGSIGTVHYFTDGHRSVPKERLEVFGNDRVLRLDNFRSLESFDDKFAPLAALKKRLRKEQDKGHAAAVAAFLDAVQRGEPSPVPFEESLEVSRAIFDALGR